MRSKEHSVSRYEWLLSAQPFPTGCQNFLLDAKKQNKKNNKTKQNLLKCIHIRTEATEIYLYARCLSRLCLWKAAGLFSTSKKGKQTDGVLSMSTGERQRPPRETTEGREGGKKETGRVKQASVPMKKPNLFSCANNAPFPPHSKYSSVL